MSTFDKMGQVIIFFNSREQNRYVATFRAEVEMRKTKRIIIFYVHLKWTSFLVDGGETAFNAPL